MDNGASSYRRFLNGDESAFDEIMERYFDSLIFFINRYVRDLHAAEDIAIDVFSDILVHPHRYNFKVTFKTYLFMIGRSRALNYIKRNRKFKTIELTEIEDHIGHEFCFEEAILRSERQKAVNNALIQLNDDMRAAVHLVYFEQLSYEDAAKVMKKNKKQVDNLLYRAKSTLRTILTEEVDNIL